MMQNDKRDEAEAFIEKVIAPARATRRPDPESERARADLHREDLELGKRALAESGIDIERLDKLAEERSEKRKKLAEDSRRRAVDASAAAADRLRDLLVHIPPLDPIDTVLDQVTFIRSFAGQGVVKDSNIGPMDNWAQYRLDSSVDTYGVPGRLSFFTLWQNNRNTPTIVTVKPNLVINANLSCEASGSGVGAWFGIVATARGSVRARTTIWSMDSSVRSIVHDEVIADAYARSGFFGDDDSASIEFNQVLQTSGVAIAPQAYSLIEVELLTEWDGIGSTVLDAADGSHRVDVPQIVITQLQTPEPPPPPPISLTAGVDSSTSPATVTLIFSGANGALVDIFENGVRLGDTENDGAWSIQRPPGTYVFRVCERMSSVCSTEVAVTVA